MDKWVPEMKSCLGNLKNALVNSKEEDSILMKRINFSNSVDSSGWSFLKDFDTSFTANGCTAFNDAILLATDKIYVGDGTGYIENLRKSGYRARGFVVFFTDGYENGSKATIEQAKAAIAKLNQAEISTVVISFGDDAKNIGRDYGFMNILETGASESELRAAMSQLSKSIISASKSANVSNSNFFTM